jgi:hypothetical protein
VPQKYKELLASQEKKVKKEAKMVKIEGNYHPNIIELLSRHN